MSGLEDAHFVPPNADTLESTPLPKYTLASFTQAELAGGIPSALARFLIGLGFSRSSDLTVEALGVERAMIPEVRFNRATASWCQETGVNDVNSRAAAVHAEQAATGELAAWHRYRREKEDKVAPFVPQLYVPDMIFYMRGLRFLYHDIQATDAAVSAALNSRVSTAHIPSAPPTDQPTVPDAPQGADATQKAMASQLAAVTKALQE